MFQVNISGITLRGDGWLEVHQQDVGTGRFRLDQVGECSISDHNEPFGAGECRFLKIKFIPIPPVDNEWDSVVMIAFHGATEAGEWMRENIPPVVTEEG